MPHKEINSKKKSIIKDGFLFRVIVLAISVALLYILYANREDIKNLSRFGYIGIFAINFISSATILLPLPGTASVFIGGSIWNPIWVGVYSGLGSAFGELFGYFLGYGGRGIIREFKNKTKWMQKTEDSFFKNGFKTTFIFAILPLPIFDVVGIIAGAVNYPVWKFFSAMVIARILRNILFAYAGTKIFG